jgi:hypothetical protein
MMFSKGFWVAAFERAVKTAAQSALAVFLVGDQIMNAFNVDWSEAFGVGLGGAAISILTSLAFGAANGNPSAGNVEVTNPAAGG